MGAATSGPWDRIGILTTQKQVFHLTMAASAAAQGDPELLTLFPQTGVARTIKAPQESPDDQISARSSAITHS